jgi:iron complex outermembrane receptor protein
MSESVSNNNFLTNIVVNNELTPVLVDISATCRLSIITFLSEMKFKLLASRIQRFTSVQKYTNTKYRDYLNRQTLLQMGRNFKPIKIQLLKSKTQKK